MFYTVFAVSPDGQTPYTFPHIQIPQAGFPDVNAYVAKLASTGLIGIRAVAEGSTPTVVPDPENEPERYGWIHSGMYLWALPNGTQQSEYADNVDVFAGRIRQGWKVKGFNPPSSPQVPPSQGEAHPYSAVDGEDPRDVRLYLVTANPPAGQYPINTGLADASDPQAFRTMRDLRVYANARNERLVQVSTAAEAYAIARGEKAIPAPAEAELTVGSVAPYAIGGYFLYKLLGSGRRAS